MHWNWELPNWPHFTYDLKTIAQKEKEFLLGAGSEFAFLKNIDKSEYNRFVVEILSTEGIESSKIEGEFLDRERLQSSIKKQFGLSVKQKPTSNKEAKMAQLLCDVYESFNSPLTHEMLWSWHSQLFDEHSNITDYGKYRTHPEPMQIVSRRYDDPQVFFEAPPSAQIPSEMAAFIDWFNSKNPNDSILGRAAIAHVYFESIHPFEDGNGRIGRFLVEKILSQGVDRPVLIAVSKILERRKKEDYSAIGKCNRTLDAAQWVEFFTDAILQAQKESMSLLHFLIEKAKILTSLSGKLNDRQEKVLLRMLTEGLNGFKGGLSANSYISITKTSKATATRDLNDLVQKGALTKTGELKHSRYWLNIDID